MKKLGSLAIMAVCLCLASPFSQAARWWNPDKDDYSGTGMDLDSYHTFTDNEGYEVTSMWWRARFDKAKSLYNPKLEKNSITSAVSMLVQLRCDTGEIKISEVLFQDRQFNTLWRLSNYPDIVESADVPFKFNQFYYADPNGSDGKILAMCRIKQLEDEQGVSLKDLQLDENGHAIGLQDNIEEPSDPNHTDDLENEIEL